MNSLDRFCLKGMAVCAIGMFICGMWPAPKVIKSAAWPAPRPVHLTHAVRGFGGWLYDVDHADQGHIACTGHHIAWVSPHRPRVTR